MSVTVNKDEVSTLTFENFTITDPEPGNWTVELFGANVSVDGEEVSLTITGIPTEPIQTMVVDIKPEDDNNTINCQNMNGNIPVAILTTNEFDAMSIDHSTVRFGKYGSEAAETHVKKKTGEVERHEEDVDNDGDIDLIFHFKYGETKLECSDDFAVLTGSTYDGIFFTGADKIQSASNNESAGYKSIIWDGLDGNGKMVSGGIYIYNLKAGDYSRSKKMLFLK